MDLPSLIGLGVIAFIATNLDDMLILMVFFSDRRMSRQHVVLGQFAGIALLVIVSLLTALLALTIPERLIGLLGLIPIALGIHRLINWRADEADESPASTARRGGSLRFLSVAAVTVSNGADNIGVYTPLFARRAPGETIALIAVFAVMVALWCGLCYLLVHHSIAGALIRRIGRAVTPFVLIGLGLVILAEAFLIHP